MLSQLALIKNPKSAMSETETRPSQNAFDSETETLKKWSWDQSWDKDWSWVLQHEGMDCVFKVEEGSSCEIGNVLIEGLVTFKKWFPDCRDERRKIGWSCKL